MYRVQLAYWMADCPVWWRNFVKEIKGNAPMSADDLAPYNGFYDEKGESALFQTEQDFTAFVLRFSGAKVE